MLIDIHGHTRKIPGFGRGDKPAYTTPAQLIARHDKLGIEKEPFCRESIPNVATSRSPTRKSSKSP